MSDRPTIVFESDLWWTVTADDIVSFSVPDPPWGNGGKAGNMHDGALLGGMVRVTIEKIDSDEL